MTCKGECEKRDLCFGGPGHRDGGAGVRAGANLWPVAKILVDPFSKHSVGKSRLASREKS
jgi:hypothetical protein